MKLIAGGVILVYLKYDTNLSKQGMIYPARLAEIIA